MKNLAILICLILCSCGKEDRVGEPYRGWQEGEMDIHHIYTGNGEANFFILPDATTLLIDAGDHDPAFEDFPYMNKPMPDKSRRPGEWIARYIQRVNPQKQQVDYLMLSHFHNDHMGSIDSNGKMTTGRNPDYKLVGLAEVGEWFTFGTSFDRGYPNYNYPTQIKDAHTDNYLAFLKHHAEHRGLKQEEFKVGKLNQIALKHKPAKYSKDFSIRNLAANGEIWNGKDEETTRYYDLNPENIEGRQNENTKSIAIRIDYGPFSYYTGGDLTGSVKDEKGEPVTGDFNYDERTSEVYKYFTAGVLADSKYLAKDLYAAPTFHGFKNLDAIIDFCYVSRDAYEVADYRVIDALFDGEHPSDHNPVVVTICKK